MGKDKSPKGKKKAGNLKDLSAKAKRAAAVKGGAISFKRGVSVATGDVTGDGTAD